jgi:glycogen debranching enzyme
MADTTQFEGTIPVPAVHGPQAGVSLISGRSFALSDGDGNMSPLFTQGLFVLDTRILSNWVLTVAGSVTEPLGLDAPSSFVRTFVGRGRPQVGHADADIVVFRRRTFADGMRELIEITNHGLEPTALEVALDVDCDFADLFEVKESRRVERERECRVDGSRLEYRRAGDTDRAVEIDFGGTASVTQTGARWQVSLEPRETWRQLVTVASTHHGRTVGPFGPLAGKHDADREIEERQQSFWLDVKSDNIELVRTLRRTADDLAALRIRDEGHPDLPLIAAGAPWFMTLFGRDSLLTSWMALIVDPSLGAGVLQSLARLQGTRVDERSGEEPGKILHEVRYTGTAARTIDEADIYYGSVDATLLFVIVAAEVQRWHPDPELLDRLLPHIDAAMDWIENYGDRDGDGFVEYERVGDYGLVNQGWKDSWDAIRHADGTLATGSIALCEVQAYTYGAYLARAELAALVDDQELRQGCLEKAARLREQFNAEFWDPDAGCFALALDGRKRRVAVASSNMGHCLWMGIVDDRYATTVAERLLSAGMDSGWGIRTLDADARAYNPVSYHNGSVWPHDNAICAWGLSRYGFHDEAMTVIERQLDVAVEFDGRPPELFAGFSRDELGEPAVYPSSCSPQAWSAASPLLWLRTILQLEPVPAEGRFWISPDLPGWVHRLHLDGIALAGRRMRIDLGDDRVAIGGTGDLAIMPTARPVFDPAHELRTAGVTDSRWRR